MEYMPQVKVSKEDFLALSDLAGDMSIMDYMSKVIHDHVAAQHSVQRTAGTECKHERHETVWHCLDCGEYV